jgi:hypothetical protein
MPSAYLANLLLGIIVMYDSSRGSGAATAAVWSQLVTVYSLLISAVTAIGTHGLSRFHSEMTIFLVMSPLVHTFLDQFNSFPDPFLVHNACDLRLAWVQGLRLPWVQGAVSSTSHPFAAR